MIRTLLIFGSAFVLAACNSVHLENSPLGEHAKNIERREILPTAPDRPVILMTFSGGGTRAATLAASVLEQLSTTSYSASDGRHSLVEDVKFVSSVSGGSVTAAWLGLLGHPPVAKDFAAFRERFLAYDGMADLESNLYNPAFWARDFFTSYVRIDAVEELFDRRLFSHATFAAMNQPGHPIIVLNSTDMAGGETFEFTPERFDDICSSLDNTPVSVGVAASAAFPIALSPVNFQDYSEGCIGSPRRALWADIDTTIPEEAIANLEEYRSARYTNDLRHGKFVFRNIEYLHLLDGGLADNLGINALRAALVGTHNDARVLKAINDGKIQRLVVITINARSDKPSKLYQSAPAPGIVDMFDSVTSVPIDANSASSQEVLSGLLDELAKAAQEARSAQFHGMTIYGITIDFDQIPADTDEHRALRDRAKDIPTSWALTAPQLQTTEEVGKFLVIHNPCFQALVMDLHGSSTNGTGIPGICPTRKVVAVSEP